MNSWKLEKDENLELFTKKEISNEFNAATIPFLVLLAGSVIVLCIFKDYTRVGLNWSWVHIRILYTPLALISCMLTRHCKLVKTFLPELPVWISGAYIVWFCTLFSCSNGDLKSDYVYGIFQYYLGIALMPISSFTFFGFIVLSLTYYYLFISLFGGSGALAYLSVSASNYVSFVLFAALIFIIVTVIRRDRIRLKFSLFQNLLRQDEIISKQSLEIAQAETDRSIIRISQSLSHDMKAPLGIIRRLVFADNNRVEEIKPLIRNSVNRLYAMVDTLRKGEIENIINRSRAPLDFCFGSETLQMRAEERKIELYLPQNLLDEVYIDHPKVERRSV